MLTFDLPMVTFDLPTHVPAEKQGFEVDQSQHKFRVCFLVRALVQDESSRDGV